MFCVVLSKRIGYLRQVSVQERAYWRSLAFAVAIAITGDRIQAAVDDGYQGPVVVPWLGKESELE